MSGKNERPAGSLKTGEPAFLAAGKIRRPHGVRGDALVELLTDFPEHLAPGKTVFIGEKHQAVSIRSQRVHNEGLLLGFDGYDSPEEIGAFRNQVLYISRVDSSPLARGEYYIHELIDLEVMDEDGSPLGILTEVIETGANDVYVVTTPAKTQILLPAIADVVRAVDLDAHTMTVHLLPGLVGENGEDA